MVCYGFVDDDISVDFMTQFRDRKFRDIAAIEVHGKVTSFQVPPDDEVPAEASQVLDRLGSQLLFAHRLVFDLLLMPPIHTDITAGLFNHYQLDVHSVRVFIPEAEA